MLISAIKKNTIWNLISSVLPMVLALFAVPFLIKKIGVEAFGILSLIWVLIGYFSIFDFGIGRALTQQISIKRNHPIHLTYIIKTGLTLMILTGVIGGVFLLFFSDILGKKWLNVSLSLQQDTINCLLVSSIGIPVTTLTSGLKGVLEGFEDFKASSILKFFLGISNFLIPILIVIFINNHLTIIVLGLVFSRLIVLIGHLIYVNKKISIRSILNSKFASKSETKEMLNFGLWMTFSNLLSPLMVNSDRFLISYMLGAYLVAYYTVPFDFIIRILVIPAALTGVLFPRFAFLYETNKEGFNKLYKKSLRIIFFFMGIITLGIILFSKMGLSLWLNSDFSDRSWSIAVVLSIGLLFNSMAQVPHAALQSNGHVKLTSIIHFFEFIIYVPFLLFSLFYFNVLGAAFAWSFRVLLDLIVLMYFVKKKML